MSRRHLPLFSALLLLCLGGGYLATLLPGIGYSGDTVKFQYLGQVLGVPHAPGYPLYLILNHLFVTLVPFGSLAYKVNLLSAVFAVGACIMLFKLLELLGTGRFIAFVIALTFGFSKSFWSQAVVAEVYTLLILLMVSVSYFLIKWHLGRRDRDFYLATALYALSFGNHLLAITLLPAFVYLVVVTDRRVFVQPKKVLWVLGVVALGAAQYLYLFWRLNDPQAPYVEGLNAGNFFYYVTGGPFRPLMFAFTSAEVLTVRLPLFLSFMRDNLPVVSVIALFGAFVGRMPRGVRFFLLIYFFSNAFYAVNYNIPDIEGYFLANDLVVAVFAGVALERLLRWGERSPKRWQRSAVVGFLLIIPFAFFATRYPIVNQSNNTAQRDELEAALGVLGEDAAVVTLNYPSAQAFLYYLLAEGWGARNLHVADFGRNRELLRAYLSGDEPLSPFVRRSAQPAPAGLPLYAYPCDERRIGMLGLRSSPSETVPRLCRVELVALDAASESALEQEGLALYNLTAVETGEEGAWRWGLGPRSRLSFHLDDPQRLTLSLGLSAPFEGQEITVEVNGKVLEQLPLEANAHMEYTVGFDGRSGENTILLSYSTWNHHDSAPDPVAGDRRPLAVRFERIALSPPKQAAFDHGPERR